MMRRLRPQIWVRRFWPFLPRRLVRPAAASFFVVEKMHEPLVCNIDRQGQRFRKRLARASFALGLITTVLLNYFQVGWSLYSPRLIVFILFPTAAVTYAEAQGQTCIVHAAAGTTEDSKMNAHAIANSADIIRMRVRALGIIVFGVGAGTIMALVAFFSISLRIRLAGPPDNTLSLVLL
jgi:hypothetical protein